MPPINILIKPASSACNMKCRYCFYNDIAQNRRNAFEGMMSIDILEKLVKDALETAEGSCTFGFQGGEPTLRGLSFYKTFMELEKKHNKKGLQINNAIQTNGTMIDDEWASFLAENRFLVGLSLDGPEEIHNLNRRMHDDETTFSQVMKAARIMNKHKVEYNILCVVTGRAARSIEKIYNFFRKQGFRYLQFIPCLEPLEGGRGVSEYGLGVKEFGQYLIRLFDLWHNDFMKGEYISIRHMDNLVKMFMGQPPEICSMAGQCSVQYVVEGDGGVYPCDFYVYDQWRLGTAGTETLSEMRSAESAQRFIGASRILPDKCRACGHLMICRNGCRRDRVEESGLNYYCEAWKEFFDYATPKLRQVSMLVQR